MPWRLESPQPTEPVPLCVEEILQVQKFPDTVRCAEGSAHRGDVRTNCFKYVILAEFFVCGIAVVFLGLS